MTSSFFSAAAPTVAVELSSSGVSAAGISSRGAGWTVTAHAAESWPAGAIVSALNAVNVHDRAAAADTVTRALSALDARVSRVALLLPDPVVKVSLVRLDNVPARSDDLDQLIRFHVRKSAPFNIDEAQVSYTGGARFPDGAREYVVAIARRDVVAEYEALLTAAGAYAGLVDVCSFNVVNAVLASGRAPAGDWLLVHVRADYASVAILRGADLLFFRNRGGEGEGSLADLVHQTAMYHEDRLGGAGIERVILTGAHVAAREAATSTGRDPETLRAQLEQRTRTRVEMFDPTSVMTLATRIMASPELLDRLAPLVGVLARNVVGQKDVA